MRFVCKALCVVFISLWSVTCWSQNELLETWSRFHPVRAPHTMVASQDRYGTLVGREVLRRGGNAVDAAVATAFTMAVTLPRAGNLGGGGFMLIWLNDAKKAVAINFREKAPMKAGREMFLNDKGDVDLKRVSQSALAVGVPGTVAGLHLAHKKFGTKPWASLLKPAIHYAQDGFIVSESLSHSMARAKDRLAANLAASNIFLKANGQVHQPGDKLIQKDLAKSLTLIAEQGPKAFYEGTIAKRLVKFMQDNHGVMTAKDLKGYRAQQVTPLQASYHGYQIIAMPPPSSGGVTLIEMLNLLEAYPIKNLGLNNAGSLHLLTEAMNLAYNDRNATLGDPDFVKMPIKKLISKDYAATLRKKINPTHHTPSTLISTIKPVAAESNETTHFVIIDKHGNIVSMTYTLNYGYGIGQVAPGTGILLNNEMDDFAAKPGAPNTFGLVQGEANAVAPGKRPLSSMTPVIILNQDRTPRLATGSPGGSRIITTVLQVILNVLDHGLNIATAVSEPRIHSQLWPDKLFYEQGLSHDTIALLKEKGHAVEKARAMGAAETLAVVNGARTGFADPRRASGLAAGD